MVDDCRESDIIIHELGILLTSSLRSTWACPKLGHPEIEWDIIVFLIEMNIFGLPSFQDKPISPLFMKNTPVFDSHRTWEKQMTPCIPFASPKQTAVPKIPIQSPLGPVFFGQGARLFLESGFLFLTEVLWRL